MRHGIAQLKSIGLDVRDCNFEEILVDHTEQTVRYLEEKKLKLSNPRSEERPQQPQIQQGQQREQTTLQQVHAHPQPRQAMTESMPGQVLPVRRSSSSVQPAPAPQPYAPAQPPFQQPAPMYPGYEPPRWYNQQPPVPAYSHQAYQPQHHAPYTHPVNPHQHAAQYSPYGQMGRPLYGSPQYPSQYLSQAYNPQPYFPLYPNQPQATPLYPSLQLSPEEQQQLIQLQLVQQQQQELIRQQAQLQEMLMNCTGAVQNDANLLAPRQVQEAPKQQTSMSVISWPEPPQHIPKPTLISAVKPVTPVPVTSSDTPTEGQPSAVATSSTGPLLAPMWVPDEAVSECPLCAEPFTLFFRRHHCRACGKVVCGLYVHFYIFLTSISCSDYEYELGDGTVRVCKFCYKQLTGAKSLEESLVKQTAQLSLSVAKNVKILPQSAYEMFMNAVMQQVPISEERLVSKSSLLMAGRAVSLSAITNWSTNEIKQLAHGFKQFCTGDASTFDNPENPEMMSIDLTYIEFQQMLGILGTSTYHHVLNHLGCNDCLLPGDVTAFSEWIFSGFRSSQGRVSFDEFVVTLDSLVHGNAVYPIYSPLFRRHCTRA